MTQKATKVVTAHIPLPLVEKVDRLAARLDRPRSWIVKQALAAWVDREERCQPTGDALIGPSTLPALADNPSEQPLPVSR
jgi:hypothetical protein